MATTIGSVEFSAFSAGCQRTAGTYWMNFPHAEGEVREFEDITAEATDGIEKVDHGYRGRLIGPIRVMLVAASADDLYTRYATLLAAVEDKADGITIVTPYGKTYANCYILSGFPKPDSDRLAEETGKWFQRHILSFTQDRE